jgi:hypothetical protein
LRGSQTVSQWLFWDVKGGLLRSPWYQEEVSGMCGFVSIPIWSFIVQNLEETNLTSRLRDQGLSRGRHQVIEGRQHLMFFYLCSRRCLL